MFEIFYEVLHGDVRGNERHEGVKIFFKQYLYAVYENTIVYIHL